MSPQRCLLIAAFFALVLPRNAAAQLADEFFQQNCASCHTIGGGRLIGPDLKEAMQQKDRAWLEHFIQDPKAILDSGDPYALQLKKDAGGIVMPKMPGLTPEMAKALLDMIEVESKLPKSSLAGVGVSEQPFTPNDVLTGTEIFLGKRRLSQAGPPCISCHTLGSIGGFGGGRLGPDLTLVYERLGGRKSLGAWLSAPATPTMQSVFRKHSLQSEEILPLLAAFEESSRQSQPANTTSQIRFFLAGIVGTVLGLTFMGWIWRDRIRTIRRALVSGAQRGAE
ncbi:MAG TPA: cytochrome c [Candidatus Acidoferrales bacterium]|nr:cytochrome c [Candidatus Acidoferrales bacterium]